MQKKKTAKSVELLYNIEPEQIENDGPTSENTNSRMLMRSCTHLDANTHAYIQYILVCLKSPLLGTLADAHSYRITFRAYLYKHGCKSRGDMGNVSPPIIPAVPSPIFFMKVAKFSVRCIVSLKK